MHTQIKAGKQSSLRCLELCSFSHRQATKTRLSQAFSASGKNYAYLQRQRAAVRPPPPPFLALCLFLCISTLAFLDTT